jgi:hypothetical protein
MAVKAWQGFSTPGIINNELHDHCFLVLAEKLNWPGTELEFVNYLENLVRLQDEKKKVSHSYDRDQEGN